MNTQEKRVRHLSLRVFYCKAQTSWNESALVFEDNTGDGAQKKVTLVIERPSDIAYIRERLQDVENAWRKELDTLKVQP